MSILLDTSVMIDHLRDNPGTRAALAKAVGNGNRLFGSVMTRVEVLAGMRPQESAVTYDLFGAVEWIPVDVGLAERAGQLASTYTRSHPGIDPVDYVIAATAIAADLDLWTRNLKHFPMFPGLQRPY